MTKDLSFNEKRKILNGVLEDLMVLVDPDDQIINHPTITTALDYLAAICEFETKKTEHNTWYKFCYFKCDKRQVERFLYILLGNKRFANDRLAQEIRENIASSFSQNGLYNSIFSAIVEYALHEYIEIHREKEDPFINHDTPTLSAIPF